MKGFLFNLLAVSTLALLLGSIRSIADSKNSARSCYEAKDRPCLENLQKEQFMQRNSSKPFQFDAAYYLGLHLFEEGGSIQEAKKQLMMALTMSDGHEGAETKLNELYSQKLVPFDAPECLAIKNQKCLDQLANDQNDAAAQYLLGSMLIKDTPKEGVKYLQKAAKQHHKTASCMLAKGTQDGSLETQQSYHDAVQHLQTNCLSMKPFKALSEKYFEKYRKKDGHKAFAYSNSGQSYFRHGNVSPEAAARSALDSCNFYNKNKDLKCRILNIDNIWVKDFTPSEIPEGIVGIKQLISKKAVKYFEDKYENATSNKVFAQSNSGAWAARISETEAIDQLKSKTLSKCRSFNGKINSKLPCKIVNLNGKWQ